MIEQDSLCYINSASSELTVIATTSSRVQTWLVLAYIVTTSIDNGRFIDKL